MEFAISLPQWSTVAGPHSWRAIAEAAERLGYDALWRGDHVAFPRELPAGGVLGATATTAAYDAFATLAYLAACTEEIALGTNVIVAPYRHPVMLAKQALTLDALTDGRFEFGVGAGWLEPEFDLLDVPHDERGARTAEFLELFDRVIDADVTGFDGPIHAFEPAGFYPRPVRDSAPPRWIGGTSRAAHERVAQFGTGWTVIGVDPDDAQRGHDRLLEAWTTENRSGTPEMAVTTPFELRDTAGAANELVGPPERVVERIGAYADAGVTRLVLRQRGASLDARLDGLERFAAEVGPSV